MTVKNKPHNPLQGVKTRFAQVDTLEITTSALRGAELEKGDFIKSETAHNPRNHRVWHDSYRTPFDEYELYLKFAGETLIDVALVSFKEA